MMNFIKNDRGVTLLEVLLAVTIMSIILLLISNVQIFGQKEYVNQAKQINHQANIRLAVKAITKDIRKTNAASVENGALKIGSNVYELSGTTIKKNGNKLIDHIKVFNVTKSGNQINVKIISLEDQHGQSVSVTTDVFLRE